MTRTQPGCTTKTWTAVQCHNDRQGWTCPVYSREDWDHDHEGRFVPRTCGALRNDCFTTSIAALLVGHYYYTLIPQALCATVEGTVIFWRLEARLFIFDERTVAWLILLWFLSCSKLFFCDTWFSEHVPCLLWHALQLTGRLSTFPTQ